MLEVTQQFVVCLLLIRGGDGRNKQKWKTVSILLFLISLFMSGWLIVSSNKPTVDCVEISKSQNK